MDKVVYDYSWGDEDVIGSHLKITKHDNDKYVIYFEQIGNHRRLDTIYKITEERYHHYQNEEDFDVYETWLTIRAVCNPPPEKLFEIK